MNVDFKKYSDGLVPAIVQDFSTHNVLMLGFMNKEALTKTEISGKVTFYSSSKKRLWTKGEESGNFLELKSVTPDCDNDTLLIKAHPVGPVCHTGADTCFNEENRETNFLLVLQEIIRQRQQQAPGNSYVAGLFQKGMNAIAQKVGEEAVELVIEAKDNNNDRFVNEAADLLFHYMILLQAKGFTIDDVLTTLKQRHKK